MRTAPQIAVGPQASTPLAPVARGRSVQRVVPLDGFRKFMLVLVVLAVSQFHQNLGPLAKARPLLILTVSAAAYAYMNPRVLNLTGLKTWPSRILFALAILACLGVPFGISIGATGKFVLDIYSKVFLLAILVIVGIGSVADLRRYVWAMVAALFLLAYLSLYVFPMVSGGGTSRIGGGYSYDANDIATVVVTCIGMTLLTLQTAGPRGKLFSLVTLALAGMTLAKTGSRGGFLGAVGAGVAVLLLLRGVNPFKRVAFVAVLLAGLSLKAPEGYWKQMKTVLSPKEDYNWTSPTGRKAVAKRGIRYMMAYPLVGIGVGNFSRAEGMISDRAKNWDPRQPGIKWSAAHNSYVQAGAEMGIVGGVMFILLVLGPIVMLRITNQRLPKAWSRGTPDERFLFYATVYFPVAMSAFAVSVFFVSFAYSDLLYVCTALNVGLLVCLKRQLAGAPDAVPQPAPLPRRRSAAPARTSAYLPRLAPPSTR